MRNVKIVPWWQSIVIAVMTGVRSAISEPHAAELLVLFFSLHVIYSPKYSVLRTQLNRRKQCTSQYDVRPRGRTAHFG